MLVALWMLFGGTVSWAELLAGAGAATLGAFLTELMLYRAAVHPRVRMAWARAVIGLPWQVAVDILVIFRALWRQVRRGEPPPSGLRAVSIAAGGDGPLAATRRSLLLAGRSLPPNTIALGWDEHGDVLIVHQLVVTEGDDLK